MYKRLIDYINKNGTLTDRQYGKYSTREKIIKFWNEIPKTIKCSASLKNFKTKIKQFILQK